MFQIYLFCCPDHVLLAGWYLVESGQVQKCMIREVGMFQRWFK